MRLQVTSSTGVDPLFPTHMCFPDLTHLSGVCVQRASKATRVRSTSTTVKITTVRTTPPASMESTTTPACARQNTQVTHDQYDVRWNTHVGDNTR